MRLSLAARFWAKVTKGDGCWTWLGATNGRYGHIYRNRVMEYAHRVSWALHHGEVPAGLNVLHRCDNPICVRPNHLFLGTQSDNINDCVAKGRFNHARAKGTAHGRAKLTEHQVLSIRADRRQQKEIAGQYGITQGKVSAIKLRRIWRHV